MNLNQTDVDELIQKVLFDNPLPLSNYKTPKTLITLDEPIKNVEDIDKIILDAFSNNYQEFKQDTLQKPSDEENIENLEKLINEIYNYEYTNTKSMSNCEIKISSYQKLELAYNKIGEERTSLAQSLIYAQLEKDYILTDILEYLQTQEFLNKPGFSQSDFTTQMTKQIQAFKTMLSTVLTLKLALVLLAGINTESSPFTLK